MHILKVDKLSFKYDKKEIITDFDIEVIKGEWLSILGPSNSGKTTLVRILSSLIKTNANIKFNGVLINDKNIMEIRKKIGFIFDNPDNMFLSETVKDEIAFGLENLKTPREEIIKKIEEISKDLDIENILEKSPKELSGGEKQKVAIASMLVMNIELLILDNAFSMIDEEETKRLLKLLSKINKEKGITIINATSSLEEAIYSNHMIIMSEGIKVVDGKTVDVFNEEIIFRDLGMKMPFMIDLSHKLKDYSLIDNVIYNMEEMVNKLWP